MKVKPRFLAALLALIASVAVPQWAVAAKLAHAQIMDADGQQVGKVMLHRTPHGTLLHAKLHGMPEGAHAFHVHSIGKCEAPFKSAGGHFNPHGHKHGLVSADGMHAGDMPNIHVPASGSLEVEILNTGLVLDKSLFDEDGASIVIHAGPDDYQSDPAGAAGPRIACGVIHK